MQTRTTVFDRQEETKESFTCLLEVGREPQVSLAVYIRHSQQCTVISKHPLSDLVENQLTHCYILSQFDVFSLNLYRLKIINVSFSLILQVLVRLLGLQMNSK